MNHRDAAKRRWTLRASRRKAGSAAALISLATLVALALIALASLLPLATLATLATLVPLVSLVLLGTAGAGLASALAFAALITGAPRTARSARSARSTRSTGIVSLIRHALLQSVCRRWMRQLELLVRRRGARYDSAPAAESCRRRVARTKIRDADAPRGGFGGAQPRRFGMCIGRHSPTGATP
jgi:hypothetical protein